MRRNFHSTIDGRRVFANFTFLAKLYYFKNMRNKLVHTPVAIDL